jgi:hypothetical protein
MIPAGLIILAGVCPYFDRWADSDICRAIHEERMPLFSPYYPLIIGPDVHSEYVLWFDLDCDDDVDLHDTAELQQHYHCWMQPDPQKKENPMSLCPELEKWLTDARAATDVENIPNMPPFEVLSDRDRAIVKAALATVQSFLTKASCDDKQAHDAMRAVAADDGIHVERLAIEFRRRCSVMPQAGDYNCVVAPDDLLDYARKCGIADRRYRPQAGSDSEPHAQPDRHTVKGILLGTKPELRDLRWGRAELIAAALQSLFIATDVYRTRERFIIEVLATVRRIVNDEVLYRHIVSRTAVLYHTNHNDLRLFFAGRRVDGGTISPDKQ